MNNTEGRPERTFNFNSNLSNTEAILSAQEIGKVLIPKAFVFVNKNG